MCVKFTSIYSLSVCSLVFIVVVLFEVNWRTEVVLLQMNAILNNSNRGESNFQISVFQAFLLL